MVNQRECCVRGQWRRMSWRAVRESEKRVIEQKRVSVVAKLRSSLTTKSSAVRMEAVTGNLQAVAVE